LGGGWLGGGGLDRPTPPCCPLPLRGPSHCQRTSELGLTREEVQNLEEPPSLLGGASPRSPRLALENQRELIEHNSSIQCPYHHCPYPIPHQVSKVSSLWPSGLYRQGKSAKQCRTFAIKHGSEGWIPHAISKCPCKGSSRRGEGAWLVDRGGGVDPPSPLHPQAHSPLTTNSEP